MMKGKKYLVNDDILGDWNVRIKSAGTGSTININIVNTHTEDVTISDKFFRGKAVDVQTTGYFENFIYGIIK